MVKVAVKEKTTSIRIEQEVVGWQWYYIDNICCVNYSMQDQYAHSKNYKHKHSYCRKFFQAHNIVFKG